MTAARKPFEKLPPLDEAIAAEQRRLYETGEASMAACARAFGRSHDWTRKHAAREGWKKPARKNAKPPRKAASRRSARPLVIPDDDAPVQPEALLQGLMKTAWRLMRALEARLAEGAVGESDTRMMANLIKMLGDFRKSGCATGENESGAPDGDAVVQPADTADDMARIRREVVERLFDPDWAAGDRETDAAN